MSKKFKWFFTQHRFMYLSAAIVIMILLQMFDTEKDDSDFLKPESLSKIAFGIITIAIMIGYTWVMMDVIPYYKKKINPDESHKELTECENLNCFQKTLIALLEQFLGFCWFALFLAAGLTAIKIY